MKTQDLLEKHSGELSRATTHPFLDGVREGNLPEGVFETWLVQDYLFVLEGLGFQLHLIARAPRRDQAVLIGGLAALEAELGWFEEKSKGRNLNLDSPRRPQNVAYAEFLAGLESEPYAANVTALWALELAYLEAWSGASPGAVEYREFVEHWTTPDFARYVRSLGEAADNALAEASGAERERAEKTFIEVLRLERGFWEMAAGRSSGGSPSP